MNTAMDEFRKITSDWIVQTSIASCLPTCLTNIAREAKKHRYNLCDLNYTFKQICEVTKYSRFRGTSWYLARDGVRKKLSDDKYKQWSLEDREGKGLKIKDIQNVISSDKCSYPIISLGAEYVRDMYDEKLEGFPQTWMEHSIVILSCTETESIIHDPYAGVKDREPLLVLNTDKLLKYWMYAATSNKMMWLEMMLWPIEEVIGGG